MVPSASTTVNASTQSRVLPYLKVAAPAALVATIPPAHAPVKVGAGGNQAPTVPSASCMAATVTPASTVTRDGVSSITRDSFDVEIRSSPIGVAPPVTDDCAPIGKTVRAICSASATCAALVGNTIPAAWPPG